MAELCNGAGKPEEEGQTLSVETWAEGGYSVVEAEARGVGHSVAQWAAQLRDVREAVEARTVDKRVSLHEDGQLLTETLGSVEVEMVKAV
jgi:hypothetical protein